MRLAYVCADSDVGIFDAETGYDIQQFLKDIVNAGVEVDLFASYLGGTKPEFLKNVVVHKLPSLEGSSTEEEINSANKEISLALRKATPFDAIYERYSPWISAPMEFARDKKIHGILEVRSMHRNEAAIRAATSVVCFDPDIADIVSKFRSDSISILPKELGNRKTSTILRKTKDVFTVAYIGELEASADLFTIAEAFASLHSQNPKSRMVYIGDGSMKTALITELSKRGLLGTAKFTGPIPAASMRNIHSLIDVAILPENEKGTSDELLISGLPVIKSCNDSDCFVTYTQGQAWELSLLMKRLQSEETRNQIGASNRETLIGRLRKTQLRDFVLALNPSREKSEFSLTSCAG